MTVCGHADTMIRLMLDECVALFVRVSVALCCRWPGGAAGAAAGQVDSVPVKRYVDKRSEGFSNTNSLLQGLVKAISQKCLYSEGDIQTNRKLYK